MIEVLYIYLLGVAIGMIILGMVKEKPTKEHYRHYIILSVTWPFLVLMVIGFTIRLLYNTIRAFLKKKGGKNGS